MEGTEDMTAYQSGRVEIILTVDVPSYLRHFDEQEGENAILTTILKHDAIRAVAELDFTDFARDIVTDRGIHDVVICTEIKDRYEEVLGGYEDGENKAGNEEVEEEATLSEGVCSSSQPGQVQ